MSAMTFANMEVAALVTRTLAMVMLLNRCSTTTRIFCGFPSVLFLRLSMILPMDESRALITSG
jgi:hypothetical protein